METIDNTMNAAQLLAAINTNQGTVEGIQEILSSDNAADLIRKLNENFEAIGQAGSGVFPEGTVLPSTIGSLDAGTDIGGMTIDDFITYGIQGRPHKFTFLHMGDPHAQTATIANAKDLMANDANISFLIITGDMDVALGSALSEAMLSVGSKMLAVVGNHDLYVVGYNAYTARDKMETWVGSNVTFGNNVVQENGKKYGSYWHKDYPLGKGKLRVIGVDQFNYPGDYGGIAGNYAQCYTQEQFDWFVDILADSVKGLTCDDYFIVASHVVPFYSGKNPDAHRCRRINKFCSSRLYGGSWDIKSSDGTMFAAIVDAYTHKRKIDKTHTDLGITTAVHEDFSNVSPAKCLGHICGHGHSDYIGPHNQYTDQLVMMVDCAMNQTYGNCSDIRKTDDYNQNSPRDTGILYNKVTIDVLKETIHIERIGEKEACEHTVSSEWNGDADDPNGYGYVYPPVTRDEITFDFNANEVKS